jgi:hypothetical protein
MSANNQVIIRQVGVSNFCGFDVDIDGYHEPDNQEYYDNLDPIFTADTLKEALKKYDEYCEELALSGMCVEYGLAFEGIEFVSCDGLEEQGIMPHYDGRFRFPGGRDVMYDQIVCVAKNCICNLEGFCFVPSNCKIGEGGRCENFKPKKKNSPNIQGL